MEPKFCEHCGHALVQRVVEENHTRPVCPACGLIVYRNPPIAAGVIAERADGKIALVLRAENPGKGLWGLPAGFMEIDETAEEAARRECLEETGLTVAMGDLLGVWSFHHEGKHTSGVLVVYAARVNGGKPRAGSDSADVKFCALGKIVEEQLAFSTHRDAIARWRKQRQQSSRGAEVKKISPAPLRPCTLFFTVPTHVTVRVHPAASAPTPPPIVPPADTLPA